MRGGSVFKFLLFSAVLAALPMQGHAGYYDPTRPAGYSPSQEAIEISDPLRLNGIIKRSGKLGAIINGEYYLAGDSINNYRIYRIQNDKVILQNQEEEVVLPLQVNNVKKPAKAIKR